MDTALAIGLGLFALVIGAIVLASRKREAVNPETNPATPPLPGTPVPPAPDDDYIGDNAAYVGRIKKSNPRTTFYDDFGPSAPRDPRIKR